MIFIAPKQVSFVKLDISKRFKKTSKRFKEIN